MLTPPFTESALQAACHTWFHNSHPALRGLGFMIHNDGHKNPIAASLDTARGLVPGIPDWCLMVPRQATERPYSFTHGLFVEFKVGKGRVSPIQAQRHEQLRTQGYQVEVVYELAHFQQLIAEYLA
ncbi:MAG: VRR-NUC domain-containing protein [Janthinobacterium lividum]